VRERLRALARSILRRVAPEEILRERPECKPWDSEYRSTRVQGLS
jgi:hypothetical protein